MRTPFKVSLVAASAVFLAAMLAALLHHNTINRHTLTTLEQLPTALVLGVIFAALALLGTWLGLRGSKIQHSPYRAGLAVALLYVGATFLANAFIYAGPRTVTFPSHEADVLGREILLIVILWGTGAPYLIALLVRRIRLLGISCGA